MEQDLPPPIPSTTAVRTSEQGAQNNQRQGIRIGAIIRDLVIVWAMTAIGGLVIGITAGIGKIEQEKLTLAIALSNFLLGSVAFTIVGCLAPSPKWRHLFIVMLASWLTSLLNVAFFNVSIAQWILAAPFLLIIMGIGGGLSSLFRKD